MILSADEGQAACPHCASELIRIRRTKLQRAFFREAFRCPGCDSRLQRLYRELDRPYHAIQTAGPWLGVRFQFDGGDDDDRRL